MVSAQRLKDALRLLTDLNALDAHQAMTSLGKQMLAFPLHPRYARMLLAAQELGCVYQAALIAALTQGRDLLIRKVDRSTREHREALLGDQSVSDLFLLMRAWSYASQNKFQLNACKALGIHAQSARTVKPLLEHFLGPSRLPSCVSRAATAQGRTHKKSASECESVPADSTLRSIE